MQLTLRFLCSLVLFIHVVSAAVTVTVAPASISLRVGAERQFNAVVKGTANTAVVWKVNGVVGGSTANGTITQKGLYKTPVSTPAANVVTITATSSTAPSISGKSVVTLLNPQPTLTAFEPTAINPGKFNIVIHGRNFLRTSKVTFDSANITASFISATEIRISGTTSKSNVTVPVVVSNPNPGSLSATKTIRIQSPVAVTMTPSKATVRSGESLAFKATVRNATDASVKWYVNNIANGNAAVGRIDEAGNFTAPDVLPASKAATVEARSVLDPTARASVVASLLNPSPVLATVLPATVEPGKATLKITGKGFATGAYLLIGGEKFEVTANSPSALTVSAQLRPGLLSVQVVNPDPGSLTSEAKVIRVAVAKPKMSYADAVAFLDRATWGATQESIVEVQKDGYEAFLDRQFSAPSSVFEDRPTNETSYAPLQRIFLTNALQEQDQLRQRMAYALSQLFVVSGVSLTSAQKFYPYYQILQNNAFGNYRDLLQQITLSPAMGEYLDMVNNAKATGEYSPNENYARELMQLFSLGVYRLNRDGSVIRDNSNEPVPTYTEDVIKEFARVFTGWTYPTKPNGTKRWKNPVYYFAPMEPIEAYHDVGSKSLLDGVILPGGYTAEEDVKAALDNIFNHSNVGPFVAERLIRNFTTSNPSPGYIGRIAAVFENNGAGVRGDLKAVLKAILLDREAPGLISQSGIRKSEKLRDPVLFTTTFLRALGVELKEIHTVAAQVEQMGLKLFYPSSVFSYYSPLYKIPGSSFYGPEFEVYNQTTAVNRINFVWNSMTDGTGGVLFNSAPWVALASDPENLLDAVELTFFRGTMNPQIRTRIKPVLISTKDLLERTRLAIYLSATSAEFQVQR